MIYETDYLIEIDKNLLENKDDEEDKEEEEKVP
jgi:hypothetical protein